MLLTNLNPSFAEDASPQNEATTVNPESTESSPPNVRVWLVDDNDQLRTLVAEVLGSRGGIECARHFSSPDALLSTLASKPGPDVILLDVQMGDRNGLDAVRPIKSLTPATRVLMFTTCYNSEWRARALNDGASDYLLKSDTLEKVVERIRCQANDPILKNHLLRRPNRSCERSGQRQWNDTMTNPSHRLFSRALKMLRSWWN